MKILGVVPARGGSKRCPGKNIAHLGGKPLIKWTTEAAIESHCFNKIVVTTDCSEIAEQAVDRHRIVEIHKRDPKLAQDTTPTLPVVLDVFDKYEADIIVTLQPTSPFRTANDIRKSIDLLISTNADSVISVCRGPDDLAYEVGFANRLRSIPNIVVPNGALFLITADALRRGESWFSGIMYGYEMPKDRSLDIDTVQDLEIARLIVKGMQSDSKYKRTG